MQDRSLSSLNNDRRLDSGPAKVYKSSISPEQTSSRQALQQPISFAEASGGFRIIEAFGWDRPYVVRNGTPGGGPGIATRKYATLSMFVSATTVA
jgi:hypothetical protein